MKFAFENRTLHLPQEEAAIAHVCNVLDGHSWKVFANYKDVPSDYIPVGNVDYVEKVVGHSFRPDFYPAFLQEHLHRKVWETDEWPMNRGIFVKPSDKHKKWTGKLTTGGWKGKKKGPYWCSERINFISEFRYYVAGGEVLFGEWYDGEEKDAPSLDFVEFPTDYCGAVDFGETDDGKFALVEANHPPYAIGWYGGTKNAKIYFEFVVKGWEYLQRVLIDVCQDTLKSNNTKQAAG